MPNIFSAIGRAVMPRRIRAEDFMMDRNGITGQEMRDEVVPQILDDASLDDPSVSPSGLPSGVSPSSDPTNEQVAPDIEDAYVRKIATDAMNRPQLPKAPSGWRSILATIAGSTQGGQAFAPLIAYGPKGMRQISEYQRYESELPEKIRLGNMVTAQHNSEVMERQRRDTQAERTRLAEENEQDRFTNQGGDYIPIAPQATGMTGQGATVDIPQSLPPSLKGKFGSSSISELPPPITAEPFRMPGGSVEMSGRISTPSGYKDVPTPQRDIAQGRRRIQITKPEADRQAYIAKTEETPPFLLEKYKGLPARLPASSIQAYIQAMESGNKAEADRIARAELAEENRKSRESIAEEGRKSREQMAAESRELRKDLAAMTAGEGMTKEQYKRMQGLSTEFRQRPETRNFNDIQASRDGIVAAASQKGSGVGDITLLRLFAKLTDPTTGVREEEYRTMQGAQGLIAQLETLLPRVQRGERLAPETRQQFVDMAEKIFQNRRKQYDTAIEFTKKKAKAAGVDPDMVINDIGASSSTITAPNPQIVKWGRDASGKPIPLP